MDKDVCEWDRLALRGGTAQEGHPNTPLGSQASNQYLKPAFFCSFSPLAKLGQRKSDEGFFLGIEQSASAVLETELSQRQHTVAAWPPTLVFVLEMASGTRGYTLGMASGKERQPVGVPVLAGG